MTLVVDASVVVGALTDDGPRGDWSRREVRGQELAAPAVLPFEVANTLRRHQAAGLIDLATANAAHQDSLDFPIALVPYARLAERAWQLRSNFTIADAAYIALAESLGATLVTLDARLSRGPGILCAVRLFHA